MTCDMCVSDGDQVIQGLSVRPDRHSVTLTWNDDCASLVTVSRVLAIYCPVVGSRCQGMHDRCLGSCRQLYRTFGFSCFSSIFHQLSFVDGLLDLFTFGHIYAGSSDLHDVFSKIMLYVSYIQ